MSETTARLGLPLLMPAQAQKHVTHNEALSLLDLLVQVVVEATDASTPPALPDEGAIWALGASPGGAWAGQPGRLARWQDGGWQFVAPAEGWLLFDRATSRLRVLTGGAWAGLAEVMGFDDLDHLGVNASADAGNRLTVSAGATLLTHEGAGHRLKINKAAAGDTASLLFQTGYSGRAEMGLAGDDGFSLKLSADGGAWTTALTLAADGLAGGAAVQSASTDATAGRLLKVGAFGLGAGAGGAPGLADLDAPGIACGAYACTGGTAGTRPAGAAATGFVLVCRQGATGIMQMLVDHDGAGIWLRTASAGTWGGWTRLIARNSLLGTVGQAAGVPTGAVIERGANANGAYVRFADGTQICTHGLTLDAPNAAAGALFQGATASSWTFPAAFAAGSIPAVGGADTAAAEVWLAASCAGNVSASFRALRAVASGSPAVVTVSATGRWF